MPHPVAIAELDAAETMKHELSSDIDLAMQRANSQSYIRLQASPNLSPIQSVDFFVRENSRRLVMTCVSGSLVVETSFDTREITINEN